MGEQKSDMEKTTACQVTPEERQRRARSIASIRHSQKMSGGDITPFAAQLFDRYIEGELTLEEVGEALKQHHGLQL